MVSSIGSLLHVPLALMPIPFIHWVFHSLCVFSLSLCSCSCSLLHFFFTISTYLALFFSTFPTSFIWLFSFSPFQFSLLCSLLILISTTLYGCVCVSLFLFISRSVENVKIFFFCSFVAHNNRKSKYEI